MTIKWAQEVRSSLIAHCPAVSNQDVAVRKGIEHSTEKLLSSIIEQVMGLFDALKTFKLYNPSFAKVQRIAVVTSTFSPFRTCRAVDLPRCMNYVC